MSTVAIPNWTASGVVPPINPASAVSTDRSPYAVSLSDLILHFSTSPDRQAILKGFLDFRAALHGVGFVRGFQWLDGSFIENVEVTEGRAPRDIDIVTFFHLPAGQTLEGLLQGNRPLFSRQATKGQFHVDAFFVQLDAGTPELLVGSAAYWYSVWSHRRGGEWKGFLRIDLSPGDDKAARANLITLQSQGGQP